MAVNHTVTAPSGEEVPYGFHKPEVVPKFWRDKYEKEAHKYWNQFYKRNGGNFFKDRHWIDREFEEISASYSANGEAEAGSSPPSYIKALEVGSGVGNTVFPLLELNPKLFFYAIDFAAHAIDLLKQRAEYAATGRCSGHVVDVVKDDLPAEITPGSLDIAMMIFVLSAISPQHFDQVIAKLAKVIKPGGVILFRDYAVGDLAQQRFDGKEAAPQKIEENFYVRSDGTRAYYFSEEYLCALMSRNGFETRECVVVEKLVENRKQKSEMRRLWIQGKFVRSSDSVSPSSSEQVPS
jgi:methyltransferase-like protein 6